MPGPVVTEGDRVVFRTVERDDAEFLQRASTDPRIRYSLGSIHHRSSAQQEEGIEEWIESERTATFVACVEGAAATAAEQSSSEGRSPSDRSSGPSPREDGDEPRDEEDAPRGSPDDGETTPIGSFNARNVGSDRVWLSYWLLPDYHGEGYGRDMAETGIDYVFENFDVHGITAGAYEFNDASRGLLEAMGFTQVARRRESRYIDGDYYDEVRYDLLRREWE
ncbi:GNAT family protein [Halobacterium sp. R2-5]|uniref:GNAT family N-acetyltransferase n=1 Tax=Halobacterium sp. R2-5 TaxID=2715751 RepID=UPI0014211697|nr:GNAT family protein [Halobacterium sp. R2-5]NIB98854.1 GNAT family N-acetyltransferase [Halobacterium sp. R2-5]